MKKIIVFGATGNVGSYFTLWARDYFKDKYEIIASGRRKTDFFKNNGIEYYPADISKAEDLEKLPKDDIHAVILIAATIPAYMSKEKYNPMTYIQSNTVGALNVLEYCRKNKVDRIIYTQSVFDVSLSIIDGKKTDPHTPRNFSYTGDHAVYVISKNTAIDLIEHYHQEYGLKKFIFRLPSIYNYSPFHYYYQNGIKTKRPLYIMIENAIKSEPIELWGNPKYSKDIVYVADFSQMICKAVTVDRNNGFYNIGTGIPVTLEEQIKTIIDVFSPKNNPSKIIYKPEKPVGGGFLMDISSAVKELGYTPFYDCKKLFMEFKKEMELNRFKELLER